ncbi:hypothetical protein IMSAGC008_00157 [Muribaculaceae bacterium]|nr:hypothetical protein IMSAGC008_00157 [Muribaculaceae bacterium]
MPVSCASDICPVRRSSPGTSALIRLVLPTPELPEKSVVFPHSASRSSSSPSPVCAETPIDGYPSDSYKAFTASSSSISSGSPSKSILFMASMAGTE